MKKFQRPLTPQMKTFLARVSLNLGNLVSLLPSGVLQYYIIRPQNISGATSLGFNTVLAYSYEDAARVVETFIRDSNTGKENFTTQQLMTSKSLMTWVIRQSKGMTEEVCLVMPSFPKQYEVVAVDTTRRLVQAMNLLGASGTYLEIIFRGVGCPLHLSMGAASTNVVMGLTFSPHDFRNARPLMWAEAMAGIKEMETAKAGE